MKAVVQPYVALQNITLSSDDVTGARVPHLIAAELRSTRELVDVASIVDLCVCVQIEECAFLVARPNVYEKE